MAEKGDELWHGHSRVNLIPPRPYSNVIGVLRIRKLTLAPFQTIQVVDVVTMSRDNGVITVPHQHSVTFVHRKGEIALSIARV